MKDLIKDRFMIEGAITILGVRVREERYIEFIQNHEGGWFLKSR
jgi:hypothetical protein